MSKPTVFISYSHKDEEWKDKLRPHLGMLEQMDHLAIWDDRKIDAGGKWYPEILDVMSTCAIAICLISADYLASKFCVKEEIPYLLERCENEGMNLIPVLVRPCNWKAVPWLKEIQMLPRDGKSVSKDFKDDWDTPFLKVSERVFTILEDPTFKLPEPTPRWAAPEKVDIDHLPQTGAELFGRQKELELLDEAWENDNTNVVSFVAWGGVGKSTLVNKWLDRMEADNFRGARRVFAWSFYSQGTGERVTSADQFITEALDWFGDPNPAEGSPWDKGLRLADLVRGEKTLLVLDGMEPLQSGHDFERGKIQDPALGMLVAELARDNQGLCVISTRETVADLQDYPDSSIEKSLEQISAEAGRALLRVGGVRGTDTELEDTARAFGNHALALNLLGAYLKDIPGHPISNAAEIPDLPDVSVKDGKHPRRVMAALAQRFGDDSPEIEILHLLGLYDRPACAGSLAALRELPAIPGLTEKLSDLEAAGWLRLLARLRANGLLAEESTHRPEALDTHPLVREHFGAQLQDQHPDAWREANNRLYEHYKNSAKELPETLEEMAPLFLAVAHGCAAGRYQDALFKVFLPKIRRGDDVFSLHSLGAFGSDLAALSGFFELPWTKPIGELRDNITALILNFAGVNLRAMGRLAEATQPLQAGLEMRIALEDWENATKGACNLSQLHLTRGDVSAAIASARQSGIFADQNGNAISRIISLATLADALHHGGKVDEASTLFVEAEKIQNEQKPDLQFLIFFLTGCMYCELLLSKGRYQNVQERTRWSLLKTQRMGNLLNTAYDHLLLGRALMGVKEYRKATHHLQSAVNGMRRAGTAHYLPHGLLARAAYYQQTSEFEKAQRDLEETMQIATRGGMKLFECDAHLAYARLYLAILEAGKDLEGFAREHLAKAQALVEACGYHRRDGEVEALVEALKS